MPLAFAAIVDENLVDAGFLAARVDDFADFHRLIRGGLSAGKSGRIAALQPADIRAAARLYATAKPAMCFHGLGMSPNICRAPRA
jgi:formate dehydrogenase major subunit